MSYFSSLLNTTTSRYTSLRRTLLSSSSEDDSSVDDPESSHVSRVLRAYYTEKNRPFPAWLGTDPRTVAQAQKPQPSFVGSAQSSLRRQHNSSSGSNSAGGGNAGVGGLGDLWASDDSAVGKPPEEPTSLRRGLRPGLNMRGADRGEGGGGQSQPVSQRQLPSQRAGSYQTQQQNPYGPPQQPGPGPVPGRNMSPVPSNSAGSGTSMQERLKARLGGRPAATPSPPLREGSGSGGVYEGQQGGASGSYEDKRPYVGAGSPWSDVDEGGYGGAGAGQQGYYDGGSSRRRDGPGPTGYGRGPSSGSAGGGGGWQRPR